MVEISFTFLLSAILISFYTSFMGGANDFANSFGTSIGSGAITIRIAVYIAIFASLFGAVFVGGHVTDTVRKGIIDVALFSEKPEILVYGLFASLIGSGLFLHIATYFGLPVSTTHAIVGAIVGFGIIGSGFFSIRWSNLGAIALSWVLSPIGGGLLAYMTFKIIQVRILRRQNPLKRAIRHIPIFVFVTVVVVVLAMIYKGLKNLHLNFLLHESLLIALLFGTLVSLIVRIKTKRTNVDIPKKQQIDAVESLFKYLQIFTAGYVAFAHGSNDVANGIGPLAGIWTIYTNGIVGLKAQVPIWILVLGGTGIVSGLAIFGSRVIKTIGEKITAVTPTRGFAAEFGAATIVLTFSKLGMPVSTTHTLVGAVIGVGLARGIGALDLRIVGRIFMSWIITIPIAAGATALTFYVMKSLFLS